MTDRPPTRVPASASPGASSTPRQAGAAPSAPRPVAKRKPAGRATRFALAGGAVGVSLALCGGMAAAAQQGAEAESPAQVRRVMVVPQPAAPATQIVVVLPDGGQPAEIITGALAVPDQATTVGQRQQSSPAVKKAAAPVTESSGS